MNKYVYDPMIKMLVKSKDVEVNGKEANWITKKGQHIAIGENGEIVAGGIPGTNIGANQSGNKIKPEKQEKKLVKSKKEVAKKMLQRLSDDEMDDLAIEVGFEPDEDGYDETDEVIEAIMGQIPADKLISAYNKLFS